MIDMQAVGRRLQAHRTRARLSIDAAARAVAISRALLYRYEAGDIVKLDTLDRLVRLYGTSIPALLGADQEHITNSVLFFERLEKLEQDAEHITTVFGPLAYSLTSDAYDDMLFRVLSVRDEAGDSLTSSELQRLRRTLRRRKVNLQQRRPGFVNIIPLAEIQRFLASGLTAVADRGPHDGAGARRFAVKEMEHLCSLIDKPAMGVQIGLTLRPLPTSGFQILRLRGQRLLVTSPFRLGEPLNLRYGVAMISGDEQALRLHEALVARLWGDALTGARAAEEIRQLIKAPRG